MMMPSNLWIHQYIGDISDDDNDTTSTYEGYFISIH